VTVAPGLGLKQATGTSPACASARSSASRCSYCAPLQREEAAEVREVLGTPRSGGEATARAALGRF